MYALLCVCVCVCVLGGGGNDCVRVRACGSDMPMATSLHVCLCLSLDVHVSVCRCVHKPCISTIIACACCLLQVSKQLGVLRPINLSASSFEHAVFLCTV